MNRLIALLLFSLIALLGGTGCFGPKKPKPNPNIAADVEAGFKQRWVDKRTGDLIAKDPALDQASARAQAEADFVKNYGFTSAAKK